MIRNLGEDQQGLERSQQEKPSLAQLRLHLGNGCPGCIRNLIRLGSIWMESYRDKISNPIRTNLKNLSRVYGNHQNKSAFRFFFGAVTPSVGLMARVLCCSPLGVPPRVVHAPNLYFNNRRNHFRVWVLLRSYMYSTMLSFIGL
jgi:hypothetical protein